MREYADMQIIFRAAISGFLFTSDQRAEDWVRPYISTQCRGLYVKKLPWLSFW